MVNSTQAMNRAAFLRQSFGFLAVAFLGRDGVGRILTLPDGLDHPEPRPGISAEKVLAADALGASPKQKVLDVYEAARSYPALFDGIACGCSCGGKNGPHRSLLVCFETMQPTGCIACQEEADLVGRLARQNKSLDEIRKAVDKEFG
jgi:hypothetical protein